MTAKPQLQQDDPRTLILTGASRGIGHATVKRFSSAGWRVITCSRHAFPENCPWAAGPEDHIQVDLADPADVTRAVAEMRERLTGRKLHALVNNAGISPKGRPGADGPANSDIRSSNVESLARAAAEVGSERSLRDLPLPLAGESLPRAEAGVEKPRSGFSGEGSAAGIHPPRAISPSEFLGGEQGSDRLSTLTTAMATWRRVFEVNFFSTIWLAQGLKEELAAAQGAIVNVTSIAGSQVHPFAGAAYATSKAALAALTREMAADFGPLGVRVNAIAPGEIDTAILSPGTDKLVDVLPMRRLGLPEEVAKAIYYLCTDQSSYVTGAELHINGGQHV